jgi:BCD family chlorophyll transporter-like MFS transporter
MPWHKNTMALTKNFGWFQIARLGLVQACLGAVVVVATSTFNRLMVVELALPALLPGLLVAIHYMVQMVRPRMGFGADQGRKSTPWMLGGMLLLAMGGILAAMAIALIPGAANPGIALSVLAYVMIGIGVSACGTSLLTLMAKCVKDDMRAPAATLVWMMMIFGFAVTAVVVGKLLDPYTPERLVAVTIGLAISVVGLSTLSLWGLESSALKNPGPIHQQPSRAKGSFKATLIEVWGERQARLFTIFVFLSMLAYSAQDLILEPFAGTVFNLSPGETTQLAGFQHAAVLVGMLWIALVGYGPVKGRLGSAQNWMVWGCLLSAVAMCGLTMAGIQGNAWPLRANIALLGLANGAFSIAAIATMMQLSTKGARGREGTRMGLWGAAQAIAFGLGGILGTGASDLARWLLGSAGPAYASVFAFEGVLFMLSAWCAVLVIRHVKVQADPPDFFPNELQRVRT